MRFYSAKHTSKCHYLFLALVFSIQLSAQIKSLNYYLPDIDYDQSIPTPEEFLGFQIGEWHVTHDQVLFYCKELAKKSNRIAYKEYAKSHEDRPLINLIFTSPANHKNLDKLRKQHLSIMQGNPIGDSPLVLYQGYSIHGNEASGSNAALLMAYYLAAGKSDKIDALLSKTIVILDPSYNPDGLQRFSTWVNMHRSKRLNPDKNDREFSEEWPGGRTNHYWFDLNRDWLLLVHPESQGRIKNYHYWKPTVLTDHHEMGSNSTFFFQPGVPERTNPNTPQLNQDLTEEIAGFHMKALDAIGSEYFMKKRYDDYYYGKGSTYPDANGAIGILFEQASARGHLQQTDSRLLSFPFAIRNQVVTSLSTQSAALDMHDKLLDYQRNYYQEVQNKAAQNKTKGYIFYDTDQNKMADFTHKLSQHQITFKQTTKDVKINNFNYPKNSFFVSLNQTEYTLVKTIFEKVNTFRDTIFYDVSTWTLPLAYGIQYDAINAKSLKKLKLRSPSSSLLQVGDDFHFRKKYESLSDTSHIDHSKKPKIALLVGDGINAYDAGSIWHAVDVRFDIPITKLDIHQFKNSKRLNKYNTLIMVNGRYPELDSTSVAEMKTWISKGGKLICIGTALRWAAKNDLLDISFKKRTSIDVATGEQKEISTETSRGGQVIGGAIFKTTMNLNHALTAGYQNKDYYSFKKGTHFLNMPSSEHVEVVLSYTSNASISGYVSKSNKQLINSSPAAVSQRLDKGVIVGLIDNPVFRGFWYNGYRLLGNALFYTP